MTTVQTDTLIHVFTIPLGRIVGVTSIYADKEHPGSNKKVEGWKWDERYWPTTREFEATSIAPSIWDPEVSGFPETLFQSGYGDNEDLLLLSVGLIEESGFHTWAPKVNHGHFFIYDEEWYLYGDLFQAESFAKSLVVSGQQYLELDYSYKPTIPIQVRRYEFNSVLGRHMVNMDFRRKIEFTVSGTEPEFRVEETTSGPPTLWLNNEWHETVGEPIILSDTFANPDDIQALELIGISDGTENQQFRTTVSPIDPFEEVEVWSYFQPALARQWEVLSGIEKFVTSGQQVHIDYDYGVFSFGDWSTGSGVEAGLIPSAGERIVVHYTKGLVALYEPDISHNYILAKDANINPIASSTYRGFVHVTTEPSDPAQIVLEAELPTASPTYLINLGNNTGRLIATVWDLEGRLLEGEEVTIEILPPQVGTFGASSSEVSAITNAEGQAKAIYNAPTTIEDVGQASDDVSYDNGNTRIEVEDITDPGTVSGLYLYKIHHWDLSLGIPSSGLDDYYVDYLDEEDVTSGVVSTQAWEEEFRITSELGRPVTYEEGDLATGKKTAILTQGGSNIVDPHTGSFSATAWSPLFASIIEDIGTDTAPKLRLTYPGNLDLPGTMDTKAYFVVGDAGTRIRAYITNRRTNKKLYSNEIALKVSIPGTISGTYFADLLSNAPSELLTRATNVDNLTDGQIDAMSGVDPFWDDYVDERVSGLEPFADWFRRTRRGDTRGMQSAGIDPISGLEEIDIEPGITTLAGVIPLGFRLKSTGITLASALDQVTYLDLNDHLPSGYYDV